MDFHVNDSYLVGDQASCLVIGLFDDGEFTQQGQELDKLSGGYLTQLKRQEKFSGEFNQSLLLHCVPQLKAGRVLLLGCGDKTKFSAKKYQQIVQTMVKSLSQGGTSEIMCLLPQLEIDSSCFYWRVRLAVEAIIDCTYQFTLIKSQKKLVNNNINKVSFYVTAEQSKEKAEAVIAKGVAIAKGVQVAKDLGNLPPNVCNPAYLADRAQQLAAQHTTSVTTTIINEAKMQELGMHSYLAVGRGSANESMMSIMEYRSPKSVNTKPIVIVGKGLTFDAGGISLKPGEGMDEMKYDMCGAASVYGLMQAVAELQLPLHVIGILAGCENMPDADAYRPGDIITTMSGKTIEILNTDAEGRMVLCDVLTYVERYQPELVIDVATLTGACVVALGHHLTGLMSNNQELANKLMKAAEAALDGVWQLPLGGEYQAQLDSNFADMANIGGRTGGAVTAGTFLSNFTEKYTWAHLDIAGTAWNSGKNKGSTGRPVALLVQFLMNYAKGEQQDCTRHAH